MDLGRLTTAIRAGYSLFYVQTLEMTRAVDNIKDLLTDKKIMLWDLEESGDPDNVMDWMASGEPMVVIAKNYHWFMVDEYDKPNKQMVTFYQNNGESFTTTENRKVLIIVGDSDFNKAIPKVLSREFMSIELSLPSVEEIKEQYNYIVKSAQENPNFVMPTENEKTDIINAAKGMTKTEIVRAFGMSIVENKGIFSAKTVARLRAKDVEKTAGLSIGDYDQSFADLQGYNNIKNFTMATIRNPKAKGIMLLGPPGVGKTHFCRCLGNESGLEVFVMEIASMFGSLVGESEGLVRQALAVVKANAPCILFVDELEKALAGVGGGQGDGGTTKRSLAQFLKFLSDDRPEGVYVVATCNDISALPPEWVRAERWDATFFIDLPQVDERQAILTYYLRQYEITKASRVDMNAGDNMKDWTGAEIKTLCRLSSMMDNTLKEASQFVVPITKTMGTEIESLRTWAQGRTVPASTKVIAKPTKPAKKALDF